MNNIIYMSLAWLLLSLVIIYITRLLTIKIIKPKVQKYRSIIRNVALFLQILFFLIFHLMIIEGYSFYNALSFIPIIGLFGGIYHGLR